MGVLGGRSPEKQLDRHSEQNDNPSGNYPVPTSSREKEKYA